MISVWRVFMICLILALSGCAPKVYYLMPDPVGDRRASFEFTPDDEKKGTIVVAYATNRKIAPADTGKYYAKEFDDKLRFGDAYVQIGSGDESWDEILDISLSANRGEDVPLTLTGVYRQGRLASTDDLYNLPPDIQRRLEEVDRLIERFPNREVTVYVHGANTSFYRAAALAAQYRHFSGRISPVIMYAWPSAESLIQYRKDVVNAEASVPAFVRFIKLLSEYTEFEKINILAYSAGAQLVTKSLAVLGSDGTDTDRERYRKSLRLGTVLFAAPDSEFYTFTDELRSYVDLVDNVTVTINQSDSVLNMSEKFNKGSRLGKPDIEEADADDLAWFRKMSWTDKLDIIEIDPDVIPGIDPGAHNYWYNHPWVSTDAIILLNAHFRPADRVLVSSGEENRAQLWSFPANYDQAVKITLAKLRDEWLASLGTPGED